MHKLCYMCQLFYSPFRRPNSFNSQQYDRNYYSLEDSPMDSPMESIGDSLEENHIKKIGSISCQTSNNKRKTTKSTCKLIMYDQTYFRGKSVEVTTNTKDFKAIKFDNALASLKIEGNCCWTLFVDSGYKGGHKILGSGEY